MLVVHISLERSENNWSSLSSSEMEIKVDIYFFSIEKFEFDIYVLRLLILQVLGFVFLRFIGRGASIS